MTEKNEKKFSENEKENDGLLAALKSVTDGLIYISETDSPVECFSGGPVSEITAQIILTEAGLDAETNVEEITFDSFFTRLTAERDWYGETEMATAKKFLELKNLLEENLVQLKVFKVGDIQRTIFAVGIDHDGRIAGVTTRAVET